MMSLEMENRIQFMLCSANFSMTLQTEIISTEISGFLKQIIIHKSFNLCCTFYAFVGNGKK